MDWPSPPPAQKPSRFSGFFLLPEPTTVRNNLPVFPDFVAELTLMRNKPLSTRATLVWSTLRLWRLSWQHISPWPRTMVSAAPPCSHPSTAGSPHLSWRRFTGYRLARPVHLAPSPQASCAWQNSGHVCLLTVHFPLSLTKLQSLRITSSECPAVQRSLWEEGWLPRWWRRGTCG